MALPSSFYGQKIADNTLKANGEPETGSWQVPITTITSINMAAVTTNITALSNALLAIGLGNLLQTTITLNRFDAGSGPASSDLAQRENKWLLRYHDATTNQKFQVSYPCADLTAHMPNSEFVDLSTGPGADVKSAFEDVVVSPDNAANSVVLDSIQFVGRNT